MRMKWFDEGERWNEKTQSEEEDNRVKQTSVSVDTAEVRHMKQRSNIKHQGEKLAFKTH